MAAALVSPVAVAQRLPEHAPFPGYERDERDLGTWDALVTAHDGHGRPLSPLRRNEHQRMRRRVRPHAIRVADAADPVLGARPVVDRPQVGPGVGAPGSDLGTAARLSSAEAFAQPPVVGIVVTAKGSKAVLVDPTATRTSVDHPSFDRRVVTLYGETADGTAVQLLRIGYTRREPTRRSSR